MKKSSIFALCALGLLAASCAEDIEPSIPQHNPQEPILNAANDIAAEQTGVLAAATGTEKTVIKLDDFSEPDAVVPIIKTLKVENLPAGATLDYKLQISKTEDFASFASIDATATEADPSIYAVNAAEWDNAQVQVFGNSPKVQHAYYRIPLYITLEGTQYRVSGLDADGVSLESNYYAFQGEFDITRINPGYVIEDAYYAFGNFIGSNTPATGVVMAHGEANVYDDPAFSYAFEVTEAQAATGFTVMIAPESVKNANGNASACFGVEDPSATEGALILGGQPIKLTAAGPYKLDVNMKDLTYTIAPAPKTLYVASTGAQFNAKCLQLYTSDFISYQGCAYINTQIRLTGQKGWNPLCYGAVDGAEPANKGTLKAGTNWIQVANSKEVGLYWVSANLVKLSYELTYLKTLSLVGAFNNWGNKNDDGSVTPDVQLKANANYNVWTGSVTVTEAGEWKIRANGDWAVSFGTGEGAQVPTTEEEAVFNGGNFQFSEAGTYNVTFDCSAIPYKIKVVKK